MCSALLVLKLKSVGVSLSSNAVHRGVVWWFGIFLVCVCDGNYGRKFLT